MDNKLYVGNFDYSTTENDLRDLLGQFGEVSEVIMIKDRDTGRSKGFSFITMSSQVEAETAIRELNQKDYNGRPLKVSIARPREDKRGGRRGRGQGGYGGQQNKRDKRREDRW